MTTFHCLRLSVRRVTDSDGNPIKEGCCLKSLFCGFPLPLEKNKPNSLRRLPSAGVIRALANSAPYLVLLSAALSSRQPHHLSAHRRGQRLPTSGPSPGRPLSRLCPAFVCQLLESFRHNPNVTSSKRPPLVAPSKRDHRS